MSEQMSEGKVLLKSDSRHWILMFTLRSPSYLKQTISAVFEVANVKINLASVLSSVTHHNAKLWLETVLTGII